MNGDARYAINGDAMNSEFEVFEWLVLWTGQGFP
jgi:hypothetical protein